MKLKQHPDDFRVEEIIDNSVGTVGPFAFYRMEKRGWTTTDALAAVRRRWHLDAQRVSFGGLKDRHAHTVQYVSIAHGPRRDLTLQGVCLDYLGQVAAAYTAQDIRANRFRVTLRDLSADRAAEAVATVADVRRDGVPNYFDDQRFGSVTGGTEFVAKLLVRGQWEGALRLALAAPYAFDTAGQKREKAMLRECWGRWAECREQLPRGHARSLAEYLAHHPTDYRGAVARLRPDLQGLYLSAYQSHLWNRILAARLAEVVPPEDLRPLRTRLGDLPVPVRWADDRRAALQSLTIPLPAARWPFDPDAPWAAAAQTVLAQEQVAWDDLKLKGLRKPFFTRGERSAFAVPIGLTAEADADDRHPGRSLVRLAFDLPRGSYATMIVKRVLMPSPAALIPRQSA